ncbi:MAG: cadmium-translocating P-type ATPase [Candidatus Heimdallarchaeota archaeon]|nr:cadmium-translocating P-type ATPase [Candidatus Heimdallarchaeota archaeon]MCK4878288.1 cadmium-translocating P-type ATPase [Candidatus Heimdallarchaeota archaeon]
MPELKGVVTGMDCANCLAKVTKSIESITGIEDVNLNLVSTKLIVKYNEDEVSEKDIINTIKKTGYGFNSTYERISFFNIKYNKNLLFFLIGVVFLITALLMDHLYFDDSYLVLIFYIPVIAVGGIPVYLKAFASLRVRTIDIDILMVIAVIGAMSIQFWEEAAEIIVLFTLAELLEAFSMDKARQSIRELMDLTPPTAIKLIKGRKHEVVPVEDLVVGDRVSVKPGGRIPIDGKLDWGKSYVDQSPITGESTPIYKDVGDKVFSGSINIDGYIIIRVTQMPEESTVARIRQLIEKAEQQKSKQEQFIQKFAKFYTPIMVIIALSVFLIPGIFMNIPIDMETLRNWLYQSLVILVISCPCALVLSTPITVVTAITRASKKGVLVKGGKYLEVLSSINVVGMDKTGTLSTGKLKVYKIEALEGYSENTIIEIASSLESHSEHKIAEAIVNYGKEHGARGLGYKDVKIFPGKGIKGSRKGKEYYIGSEALVNEALGTEACDLECEETESIVSYVVEDKSVIAHIHMSDELRPETKDAISSLKKTGVKDIIMLTGDNEEVASKIAEELGISYQAELLPEEKVDSVKHLKEKYKLVAMVGDGINDAPALALSDVGIAMGAAGTAIAIETADIVLSSDNLFSLPYLFRLSKQTKRTIQTNIFLSLFIKFMFFVLVFLSISIITVKTFFGDSLLWLAVLFGDMGASLLVILNAMRVGRKKFEKSQKEKEN